MKKFKIGLLITLIIILFPIPVIMIQNDSEFGNSKYDLGTTTTTSVTVTKYDAHGIMISNISVTYQWMEANLPIQGDGVTRYYCQGPTFDNTNFDTIWNPTEDVNVESRDYGRPKGTDVKDLCDLAGGATPGCIIKIKAEDNFVKWFDYENIYNPDPRQGKLVVTWYNEDFGGYVTDYSTGMRLLFFADNSTNTNGLHVFGIWDMHETLPESRYHYYCGGVTSFWPSSSGLSVQVVSNIEIYEPNLISCDASGVAKQEFAPGEIVYVKGLGLEENTDYDLWIQPEPVSNNRLEIVEGVSQTPITYIFDTNEDPSGTQETISTNASGDFDPIAIWTTDSEDPTPMEYDIIADNCDSGTVGTYDTAYDYMDSPGFEGFTIDEPALEAPDAPILDPINPNPDYDGTISLNWSDVDNAENYTVYRHTSPIYEINESITNLANVTASAYTNNGVPVGTYYYAVTATNDIGTSELSNNVNVTVSLPPLPEAAFIVDNNNDSAPLTVHFIDQSINYITSWKWDFNNDGTTDSTMQNPYYTYHNPGLYTVNLTVSNFAGTDSEVKVDYINVTEPPMALQWGPYITATTTNETIINVKVTLPSNVTVEYDTEAEYIRTGSYRYNSTDGTCTQLHHIPLVGLNADTIYHYRVLYNETNSTSDFHFRTFPTTGPFTFMVFGDSQDELPSFNALERFKLVADNIAAQDDVAFVLIVGDLVNNGDDLADWNRFFEAARLMLSNTTLYTVLGNHEDNSTLYYENFGYAEYYSFDCSDAHFTILDSNTWANYDEQAEWLEIDLDNDKTWKFVAFHHPLYTSDPTHYGGWANLQIKWENKFQINDVDAVWNGHVHAYERYLETDIQYMVLGTGGGPLDQLSPEKYEGYMNSLEHVLAYAKVFIDTAIDKTTIQIIKVAEISLDNTEVITVFPSDTIFETVVLDKHGGVQDDGNNNIVIAIVISVVLVISVPIGAAIIIKIWRNRVK